MEYSEKLRKFLELNEEFMENVGHLSNGELQETAKYSLLKCDYKEVLSCVETLNKDPEAPFFIENENYDLKPVYSYEDILEIYPNEDFKLPEPEAEISL